MSGKSKKKPALTAKTAASKAISAKQNRVRTLVVPGFKGKRYWEDQGTEGSDSAR